MTNEQTQQKPRSLEEALADLKRPEVRTSLDSYVPASFEAMRDTSGGDFELLADAVHFMLDSLYRKKMPEGELTFLHEIVDITKKSDPEKRRELEEILYQKGKRFILERAANLEGYILATTEIFLKNNSTTEGGRRWLNLKAQTKILLNYCINSLSDPGKWIVDFSKSDETTLKEKSENLYAPIVPNPMRNYIDALTSYKAMKGLKVDAPPVDISILRNTVLIFGEIIGPFRSVFGMEEFYRRFYAEVVQEIPGLKKKIADVGRKYGIEMKTE